MYVDMLLLHAYVPKSTGCPKKNAPMFETAITPTKLALGIKVG